MASIYDYSTTAASNTSIDGTDVSGATGKVKDGDNVMRSIAAFDAQFIRDLGAVNTVAGTGDVITVTLASGITAYATGEIFRFIAGAANTTNVTLNVNSIGAKAVRKISGGTDVPLVAGDLVAGETYTLIYRASANSAAGAWVLVGRDPSALSKTNNLSDVASAATSRTNLGAVGKVVTQVFTGSGTYTPTANMVYCITECVGGGGSGGGAAGTATAQTVGGGGGGGGYSRKVSTAAAIGVSQTVTIGAGGAAPSAGNNAGNAGGDTSLGAICIGKGGSGGGGSLIGASLGLGGAGGVAGTGDLTTVGDDGDSGVDLQPSVTAFLVQGGGKGGRSFFGGGGKTNNNANGTAGKNYGGGGGGGSASSASNFAGGAGAGGVVVITEFCSA